MNFAFAQGKTDTLKHWNRAEGFGDVRHLKDQGCGHEGFPKRKGAQLLPRPDRS
jgi:hypothetical protein